jgi:hypothetical protein
MDLLLRTLSVCVALAGTEMLHGIARTVLLAPRVGKQRALELSIVSGTLLAFGVCYLLVPRVGLRTIGGHVVLGVALAAFMASFDIALGRWLLRRPWAKVRADFDPRTGNYLVFGLAALVLIPALVFVMRGR